MMIARTDGFTFLDFIAKQVGDLRTKLGVPLAFMLMNSFATSEDTKAYLAKYKDLAADGLPLEFLQNRVCGALRITAMFLCVESRTHLCAWVLPACLYTHTSHGSSAALSTGSCRPQAPKVTESDFSPAEWPSNPGCEWCPPGHGDLYPAMLGSVRIPDSSRTRSHLVRL